MNDVMNPWCGTPSDTKKVPHLQLQNDVTRSKTFQRGYFGF